MGEALVTDRLTEIEHEEINALYNRLVQRPLIPFPKLREQIKIPATHGTYIIRDAENCVLHVGRTLRGKEGLRQRFKNHLYGQSSFVEVHMANDGGTLRQGHTFQYLEVSNDRQRALLEHFATARLCPRHLGLGAASNRTHSN